VPPGDVEIARFAPEVVVDGRNIVEFDLDADLAQAPLNEFCCHDSSGRKIQLRFKTGWISSFGKKFPGKIQIIFWRFQVGVESEYERSDRLRRDGSVSMHVIVDQFLAIQGKVNRFSNLQIGKRILLVAKSECDVIDRYSRPPKNTNLGIRILNLVH